MKKILVLGGTGAMGVYLVPKLIERGYAVDVVSLDDVTSDTPNLTYIKGNCMEIDYVGELVKKGYDGIVDFMVYNQDKFEERHKMFLDNTSHYIYLSTYRIYANEEHPVKETSPRLLDASTDAAFLATDDYSLYKAKGENVLLSSKYTNWTAIRPAITYSKRRFQLVILEAPYVVGRTLHGKKLVLPKQAKDVQATMSWAGDVAEMIARLLFNPKAYREIFSVCTAEHMTWGEVADIYKELIGLDAVWVDMEDFLEILTHNSKNPMVARYQLIYDRLFDRIMDNTKVLEVTGMKQSELTTLYDGLKRELAGVNADTFAESPNSAVMDQYLRERGLEGRTTSQELEADNL